MQHWTPEADIGTPWWWQEARPSATEDELPERCDIAVIGAGYTGLSAAIAAHDSGVKVVVLEAGVPGEGASSRNGGMFGSHPRLSWDKLAHLHGETTANAIFAEAKTALDWAGGFIRDEAIDCDLQQTGRIQLAWTKSHFEAQKRLQHTVSSESDVEVELLTRDTLGQEIETPLYHGGLVFPEHSGLHPAKYHRDMLNAVRRRDIPVVSHARVEEFENDRSGRKLHTPKGVIRAEKVILATNGYTTKPFKWHMARVFALPSFLIATEELPANLIGHLAPGRRMMVETRMRHSYFRISPDGKRILFGGRAAMRNIDLNLAAERLRQTMIEIWPDLQDTKITHVWTGNTGFSFAQMPKVGEQDGVCFAMGFSGSGTVMAPYLGAKAAYLAVGDARAETAYLNTKLARSFLHPFERPHFLGLADLWFRHVVDRKENSQARH